MSDIRAIDPAAVADLGARLAAAADDLRGRGHAVADLLRSVGRDAGPATRILDVASALDQDAAAVRERVADVRRLEVMFRRFGEPGPAFPRPDTRYATVADAEAAARALAARIRRRLRNGDEELYEALADLGADARDPVFAAALFAALGDRTYELAWVVEADLPWIGLDAPTHTAWQHLTTAIATALQARAVRLDDVLRYASPPLLEGVLANGARLDPALRVDLGVAALDRFAHGAKLGLHPPTGGLMTVLAADPEVAAAVLLRVSEPALREMLGGPYEFHEGVEALLSSGLVDLAVTDPETAEAAFGRIVRVAARHDDRFGRDAVQVALAEATGVHLDAVAAQASAWAPESFGWRLGPDRLAGFLARLADGNDAAFDLVHGGAAAYTAERLAAPDALTPGSVDVQRVGAVHGLLAAAHERLRMDDGDSAATLWELGATALTLVPTPGGVAVKIGVSAVKAAAGAFGRSRAQAARDDAAEAAARAVGKAREQGLLVLAVALYEADRAALGDGPRRSALTPPAALLGPDGSLRPFAELRDAAGRAALAEWMNSRPVQTAVNEIDDEYLENFATASGR